MSKRTRNYFIVTGILFVLFIIFTVLVMTADVQPIGPEGSSVGLASVNGVFADAIGVNKAWYGITDLLGYAAIAVIGVFAVIGVIQFIKRKSFVKVDREILALGALYILIICVYGLFEVVEINYRPIIMDAAEGLEASYPSSHTMLVSCVMLTTIMYANRKIASFSLRAVIDIIAISTAVITVIGRAISGVHWLTDIIAGVILSAAIAALYYSALCLIDDKQDK